MCSIPGWNIFNLSKAKGIFYLKAKDWQAHAWTSWVWCKNRLWWQISLCWGRKLLYLEFEASPYVHPIHCSANPVDPPEKYACAAWGKSFLKATQILRAGRRLCPSFRYSANGSGAHCAAGTNEIGWLWLEPNPATSWPPNVKAASTSHPDSQMLSTTHFTVQLQPLWNTIKTLIWSATQFDQPDVFWKSFSMYNIWEYKIWNHTRRSRVWFQIFPCALKALGFSLRCAIWVKSWKL